MTGSKLYNRYAAQLSAQFGQYDEAEEKLVKYLELEPSLINKHLTYNDLLLYTYRQFDNDDKAMERELQYALEHIDILPKLIANFKKLNYDFEQEYIASIEVAVIIYKHQEKKEEIMELCTKLARMYKTNKKKKHKFATLAYEISHEGITDEVNLKEEMDDVFEKLRDNMKKPKEY